MRLGAGDTAIVLDSTADFPEAPRRFPGWRVVPLYVRFGDDTFRDYVDLGPDEFYRRLQAGDGLPATAQPTPADFAAVYDELRGRYARILSLHLPATLSGTLASARAAAEGIDEVRVVDTGVVSAATAMLALAIGRRLERGTSDEEVDALVERYRAEHGLLFTVDTLDFLARGGRIGRAAALTGSLLSVKPILTIAEGEVVPLGRVRGARRALADLEERFDAAAPNAPTLRVGLAHAAAPDRLAALREAVARVRPRATIEIATALGAVVGAHAGPGTLGLFWFDDAE